MRFTFTLALVAAFANAQQMLSEEDFAMEQRHLEDEDFITEANVGRQLSHYNSQTFKNGKSRRYGLTRSRYYKLKTAIQVTNAGAKEPGVLNAFTNPVSDPEFADADALTENGAKAMFALGKEFSEMWANPDDNWVDFTAFNSAEVYAMTNDSTYEKPSLAANILGAFAGTEVFPVTDIATVEATAVVSTDTMLGGATACTRLSELNAAIEAKAATIAMQDDVTTWLEHVDYWADLRTLIGEAAATDAELYQAAEEIEAALAAGATLELALSSTQLRYNKVAANRNNYTCLAGAKESSYLATWELQQLMLEVSKIARDQLTLADATLINKYWTQAATATEEPKLYMLSGDEALMNGLLGLFNNLYLAKPSAASSLSIDFYECQYHCYWYDEIKVEVVYCPDGADLENSCTLIDYNRYIQDYRGGARAYNFEKFIQQGLTNQKYSNGYSSEAVADVCGTSYVQYRAFNSPSRFYNDLLNEYGFTTGHYHSHGGSSHSHSSSSSGSSSRNSFWDDFWN